MNSELSFVGVKRERPGSEDESEGFGARRIANIKEDFEGGMCVKMEKTENGGAVESWVHGDILERAASGEPDQMDVSALMEGVERAATVKKEEMEKKERRKKCENVEAAAKKIAVGKRKNFGKGKGKGKGRGMGRKDECAPQGVINDDDDHDDHDDHDATDQKEPRATLSQGTVKTEKRRSSESETEYYYSSESYSYYDSSSEEEEEEEEEEDKGKQARKVKREGKARGRAPLPPPLNKGADGRTLKFKIRGRGEGVKWDDEDTGALVEALRLYPCGDGMFKKYTLPKRGSKLHGRNHAISLYIADTTGILRSEKQVQRKLKQLRKEYGNAIPGLVAGEEVADPWGDPAVNTALIEAAGLYPPCGNKLFKIEGGGDRKYGRNEAIARYIEVKTGVKRSNEQVAGRLKNLKKKNGDDPVLGHAAYDAADPDMVDPWGDPAVNAALVEAAGLYPPCGNKLFRIDGAGDRKYGRNEAIARYIEVKTGVKRSTKQVGGRLKNLKKKNGDDPVLGHAAYDAADPDVVDPWGDPAVNAALIEAAELYPPCGLERFRIDGAGDRKYGRLGAIARYIEVKTGVKRSSKQVQGRLRAFKKK